MRCLAACFSKTAVFSNLRQQLTGTFDILGKKRFFRHQSAGFGERKKIADVLRDYQNWSSLHENTPLGISEASVGHSLLQRYIHFKNQNGHHPKNPGKRGSRRIRF